MNSAALPVDGPAFAYIRKLVRKHAAIALDADKNYLVESRLLPVTREHGLTSIRELVYQLRQRPFGELHRQVIEAMATNETSFFRDLHPFGALKDDILPKLIAARKTTRTLTIWSAACSTGQEPYSIAMLLAEHFPQLANWDVQIRASDLSQQVIDRAITGEYTQLEANRGLSAALLAKHFDRHGLHWRLKPQIRRRVQFSRLNLIAPWPSLPRLDIVFLRNVLIYFTPETKRQVLTNIKRHLANDGVLFLGGSETPLCIDSDWERASHGETSSYRIAAR